MRSKRIFAAGAVIAALTLAASACGSGGSDGDDSSSDSAAPVVARGCQPENPLVPGNTGESCGHDIIELFTSTLYRYDAETSEPVADLAESVQTNDNQNFTVRIKKGVKFHDGTEVKAKNFVDAWNYTANGKNAQYTLVLLRAHRGLRGHPVPQH